MVLWISAIRRCSVTRPGRPIDFLRPNKQVSEIAAADDFDKKSQSTVILDSSGDSIPIVEWVATSEKTADTDNNKETTSINAAASDDEYSAVMLRLERRNLKGGGQAIRNTEAEAKLIHFLTKNNACAECSAVHSIKYVLFISIVIHF